MSTCDHSDRIETYSKMEAALDALDTPRPEIVAGFVERFQEAAVTIGSYHAAGIHRRRADCLAAEGLA